MAKVNWTLKQAAAKWGVSPSLVYKWVLQKRIKFEALGGGEKRPMFYVVTDSHRPPHAEHLSAAQRAVWPERRPKGPPPERP